MHIIEELIAERATKLMSRKYLFPVIRPLLYRLLAYDAAVFMADAMEDKTGNECFQMMSERLNPRLGIKGLHNIPEKGRCVVIANHPTGLADGMAVYQGLKDRRPDLVFLANADALRVMPKSRDLIIPVEWVKTKRNMAKTRQTLVDMRAALNEERCLVIFPSGALAQMTWRGLVDRPWESSAAMVARKYNAPIIPLHLKARNSWLYYFFAKINGELRDITLFRELLNKRYQPFQLTFDDAIASKDIAKNADEATAQIRAIVERL
ncbi:MAG: 1-acyl-sn-glycerol-3-phosphate acyltransferase [Maricaulaceae bacterium]